MHRLVAALVVLLGSATARGADDATSRSPVPKLRIQPDGYLLEARLHADVRFEESGSYPVDGQGTSFDPGTVLFGQVRPTLVLSTGKAWAPVQLALELEGELRYGMAMGRSELEGEGLPRGELFHADFRRAQARASFGPWLHVTGGMLTTHWGMGLLANDGTQGWTPTNARFSDPLGGDRVWRAMVTTLVDAEHGIGVAMAYDVPIEDGALRPGDEARNIVLSGFYGLDLTAPDRRKDTFAGAYLVSRKQENPEGRGLDVTVFDVSARHRMSLNDSVRLELEGELVYIAGTTTLGPTPEFPEHQVSQLGLALRLGVHTACSGALFDFVVATGDPNFDDEIQSGFKANPNFEMGMLLFKGLMAAQTGRGAFTAADPGLVGVPALDLDRFPSRGSITNTLAFYPRAYWNPWRGLSVYGGVLLALAAAPQADPLQTRLAGGAATNALGARPGPVLGTELDLGLRYRLGTPIGELTFGVEGAILIPGSALQGPDGGPRLDPLFGVRAAVQYKL
jgi:hypothetical protein